MQIFCLVLLSFFSIFMVIDCQILFDFEMNEKSSNIEAQQQISLNNYVVTNCYEQCKAYLDYPFVNIQCCEQQLQGTVINLVRNTTSTLMNSTSISSKDNIHALAVESQLRITTYDRSVNFIYKVEDSQWVNQDSLFQNLNVFKIGSYSYFVVTIENVPKPATDKKLLDQNNSSNKHTNFNSKSIFANYKYDQNKNYSSSNHSAFTYKHKFYWQHNSAPIENASSFFKPGVEYIKKIRLWHMERSFKLQNKLYPVNIFDVNKLGLQLNESEEKKVLIGDFGYDTKFGKGIFWIKDSNDKLYFFQSDTETLNYYASSKPFDLGNFIKTNLDTEFSSEKPQSFIIKEMNSYNNIIAVIIKASFQPNSRKFRYAKHLIMIIYVDKFYLQLYIKSTKEKLEPKISDPDKEEFPDEYKHSSREAGVYGGYCKCISSGYLYAVGDKNSDCASLSCKNGEVVNCFREKGEWSYKTVSCNMLEEKTLINIKDMEPQAYNFDTYQKDYTDKNNTKNQSQKASEKLLSESLRFIQFLAPEKGKNYTNFGKAIKFYEYSNNKILFVGHDNGVVMYLSRQITFSSMQAFGKNITQHETLNQKLWLVGQLKNNIKNEGTTKSTFFDGHDMEKVDLSVSAVQTRFFKMDQEIKQLDSQNLLSVDYKEPVNVSVKNLVFGVKLDYSDFINVLVEEKTSNDSSQKNFKTILFPVCKIGQQYIKETSKCLILLDFTYSIGIQSQLNYACSLSKQDSDVLKKLKEQPNSNLSDKVTQTLILSIIFCGPERNFFRYIKKVYEYSKNSDDVIKYLFMNGGNINFEKMNFDNENAIEIADYMKEICKSGYKFVDKIGCVIQETISRTNNNSDFCNEKLNCKKCSQTKTCIWDHKNKVCTKISSESLKYQISTKQDSYNKIPSGEYFQASGFKYNYNSNSLLDYMNISTKLFYDIASMKQEMVCPNPSTNIKCALHKGLETNNIIVKLFFENSNKEFWQYQKDFLLINKYYLSDKYLENYNMKIFDVIDLLESNKLPETKKWFIPKGFKCELSYSSSSYFPLLNSYSFKFGKFDNLFPKNPQILVDPHISIRTDTKNILANMEINKELTIENISKIYSNNNFVYTYNDILNMQNESVMHFANNFTISILFPEDYYAEGVFSVEAQLRVEQKIVMIIAQIVFLIVSGVISLVFIYMFSTWMARIFVILYYNRDSSELENRAFETRTYVYFSNNQTKSFGTQLREKYIKMINFNSQSITFDQDKCIICLNTFTQEEKQAKLQCKHYFHINCLKKWINTRNANSQQCLVCKKHIWKNTNEVITRPNNLDETYPAPSHLSIPQLSDLGYNSIELGRLASLFVINELDQTSNLDNNQMNTFRIEQINENPLTTTNQNLDTEQETEVNNQTSDNFINEDSIQIDTTNRNSE